jgi:DNA-binding MarR family transcriptional regulator
MYDIFKCFHISPYKDMDTTLIKSLTNKFSSLSAESRFRIVLLCQNKELSITALSKKLNMSHNSTSRNVGILEKENLVSKTRHKNNTVTVKSLVKISKNGIEW